MKLFGFRINSGEIKDVREIEKTLESIEEKKNKITALGLVEITRKKIREPLDKQLKIC